MRFAIASDLHLEFSNKVTWSPEVSTCDAIILAGDIAAGDTVIDAVDELSERFPTTDILWVAGNHEFYHANIDDQIASFRAAAVVRPKVHFLENDSVEIGDCHFIGCTLWTGFDAVDPERAEEAMMRAQDSISDFRLITYGQDNARFTPVEAACRFNESMRFLERSLSSAPSERTVVITHFPPGLRMRNMNFGLDLVTAYFQANAEWLIHEHDPSYWIHGHNHYNDDFVIGRTRVVSNQFGYPREITYARPFNSGKVLTL